MVKVPGVWENYINHLISEARGGSVAAARILLVQTLEFIRADKSLVEPLKSYFATAIDHIVNGADPNNAFFLVKRQGEVEVPEYEGPNDVKYKIARMFRDLKNRNFPAPEIGQKIHQEFGIKLRRAQEIHRQFKAVLDEEDACRSTPY
jgi:hypothetical protein